MLIIIPIKKYSKRLKNKNFLIFNDKSLMERTITFSKKINNIDQIIVSSDSSEISYLKKKYKDILFLKRPKYLSTDKSLIINTINYLYNSFDKKFKNLRNGTITFDKILAFWITAADVSSQDDSIPKIVVIFLVILQK